MSIALIAGVLASSLALAADEEPGWISEGPYLGRDEVAFELPLEVRAHMLYVQVSLGGKPRRFLFDTGSPSLVSAALASELGLEIVDRRQGRDSHGAVVETGVAQPDLVLGDTTLHKVPVFVAEFPKTAGCLFDGVLGSEVLPLCAWQIDLPDGVLRCSSDPARLGHRPDAGRMPLHDFGYPHAPILEVRFADNATSKALFDTGTPGFFALSPPDFDGAGRNGGVGGTIAGYGSLGGSLGGLAPDREQLQVALESLEVGNVKLGRVGAELRESPPSLVGASTLERFVVTLDARSATAWFDRYDDGPFVLAGYGLGLDFEDGVAVSLVWENSPAAEAGMHAGQRITSINGKAAQTTCDGIRDTVRAMSEGNTVTLEWEGGAATLEREAPDFDTR